VIIVDANVLAIFYLPGPQTDDALRLAEREPEWASSALVRHELRSVLANHMQQRGLKLPLALAIMESAEQMLSGRFFELSSLEVLALAEQSGCSAYDCEYVLLAQQFGVPLVTDSRQLQKQFPRIATPLSRRH
jgi:predicted nucleic acid-binding protein